MPIKEDLAIEPVIETPTAAEDSESDDDIHLEKPIKEKKPRTQKQIDAFNKAVEVKKLNAAKRKELKEKIIEIEKKELVIKKTRQELRKERDDKQQQKLNELELKATSLIEDKKPTKKRVIKYVDSDGESEEELEHKKPIVIVNKICNTPQPIGYKKIMEIPKKTAYFV
jgi:hypothetical protein